MAATRFWRLYAVVLLTGLPAPAAWGRIMLITLPVRQRVEIQLDNPNATLVEEERTVPLVKGENQVDFSWANTQIDPETILFRVLGPAGEKPIDVKVLSVSYPPNESALIWTVAAGDSGSARVRISYILGNLTKSFTYRAIADHDEKTLSLSEYMRLENFSNEEFGATGLFAGFGKEFLKPIGLDETKEMLVARFDHVPVRKTYTCDPQEFGYLDGPQNKLRVPMHYVLKNAQADQLGSAPLPYGKVRIFIAPAGNDPDQSTTFLGEDWGQFTPIDDEMKLFLGVAQDIVIRRIIEANIRHPVAGNLFNQDVVIRYEIENFKDQPVTLDVQESPRFIRQQVIAASDRGAQWEIAPDTTLGKPDSDRSTIDRLVFHADLPARNASGKADKLVLKLHLILKNEW